MTRVGLVMCFLVTLAQQARADVCVVLDESRDTLSPEDRRGATISFGQALAKAGVQVTNANCTVTYTFYNVKLGDAITVYAIGPAGTAQARASKIDELPLVYEQLTHSMVTGQPMGSMDNVDRTNAIADQMAPRRVSADGLKYVRLGYGAVTGKSTDLGTAFGLGYRYELDQLAIDVSMNFVWASSSAMDASGYTTSKGGINGELIGIGVVAYADPLKNSTLYYGGRVGYGLNDFYDSSQGQYGTNYTGSGLQLTGVIGYETLRASTIRLFVEVDATAPLYTSSGTEYDSTGISGTGVKRWAPVIALTVGAGLGHSNTVAVVNR
jgi:hypothetical protein